MVAGKVAAKLKMSPFFVRFCKSASWVLAGTLITKLLATQTWLVVGKILGQELYGRLGIIQSSVNTFAVFAAFGISLIGNTLIAKYRDSDPRKVGGLIGLSYILATVSGLLTAVAVFALAPVIAERMLKAPELVNSIRVSSLILLFYAYNGCQNGILAGLEAFRELALASIIAGATVIPLQLAGAWLFGFQGGLFGMMLEIFMLMAVSFFFIERVLKRRGLRPVYRRAVRDNIRVVFILCFPVVICGLMVAPIKFYAESITFKQPGGQAAFGLFTAIAALQMLVMYVGQTLNSPVLTYLAQSDGEGGNVKFARFNILFPWIIGSFASLFVVCVPEMATLYLGDSYNTPEFRAALIMIMLTTIIMMYKQGLARALLVKNMMWLGVLSNLLWGIALLASLYFLCGYGVVGLAAAYLIAYVANTVVVLPLYIVLKMVPRETMISPDALAMWVVILLTIMIMINFHLCLPLRLLLLAAALAVNSRITARIVHS